MYFQLSSNRIDEGYKLLTNLKMLKYSNYKGLMQSMFALIHESSTHKITTNSTA
jgi:hypothetical protein